MTRILLGGSPCTKFSIAQKNDRETQPNSGIGWELFKNYLIAKEKFKPDYFLYENNVSAAQPIKAEIRKQLGVRDLFNPNSDVDYIEINSALVLAQNRERFYVHNCGEVGQPKDREILLKDVLISGYDLTGNEKSYALTASYNGVIPSNTIERKQRNIVVEPICVNAKIEGKQPSLADRIYDINGKMTAITTAFHPSIAEPIQVGAMPTLDGQVSQSQGSRIYNINAKSVTLKASGGGGGAKTGLYAIPINDIQGKARTLTANYWKCSERDAVVECAGGRTMVVTNYNEVTEWDKNGKPTKAYCYADEKIHTVYEVKDGKITIKGKEYPIKLPDGFYIIRKLTVAECRRLQTIPDWYQMPCSPTQNYKMLGNGWTIEVIKHILSHIPGIASGEPIEVLSMYDGMSCAGIALKELGANVVKYYATEIDKYAIQTTQANFPDTIQLGDAFQVREKNWKI